MRLVIEREGGFTVVEDADAITEIDVLSDAVVLTIEVGGDKWTTSLPVSGHAEACRVSAAIAVRCGTLVEPLAEAPEVDGEGGRRPASERVEGEPPRDGRFYVCDYGHEALGLVRWVGGWLNVDDDEVCTPVAHLPTPIPNR